MSDGRISVAQLFQFLEAQHPGAQLLGPLEKEVRIGAIEVLGGVDVALGERGAATLMRMIIRSLETQVRGVASPRDRLCVSATHLAQAAHNIIAPLYGFQSCRVRILPPTLVSC